MNYNDWKKQYIIGEDFNTDPDSTAEYRPIELDKDNPLDLMRGEIVIHALKDINANNDIWVSDKVKIKRKKLHNIDLIYTDSLKEMGIKAEKAPKTIILSDTEMQSNTPASYNFVNDAIYIRENAMEALKNAKQDFGENNDLQTTLFHELYHFTDAEQYKNKFGGITHDNSSKYKQYRNDVAKKQLDRLGIGLYNLKEDGFLYKTYKDGKYDETYTELRAIKMSRRKKL